MQVSFSYDNASLIIAFLPFSQEFPEAISGEYVNESTIGPVTLKLSGVYSQGSREKVALEFKRLVVQLGPITALTKQFAPGQVRGFWRTVYADAGARIFYTNKGSLFIMVRVN